MSDEGKVAGEAPRVIRTPVVGLTQALAQPKRGYRFGPENLVLTELVEGLAPRHILDLGAGSGILGLLLASVFPEASLTLCERNAEFLQLLELNRSCVPNPVVIAAGDIRTDTVDETADLIVANPPFFTPGHGRTSKHSTTNDATHAHHGGLHAFVEVAARRLSVGGHLLLVYPSDGLDRVMSALDENGLFANELSIIWARHTQAPYRVWVRASRQASPLNIRQLSACTER